MNPRPVGGALEVLGDERMYRGLVRYWVRLGMFWKTFFLSKWFAIGIFQNNFDELIFCYFWQSVIWQSVPKISSNLVFSLTRLTLDFYWRNFNQTTMKPSAGNFVTMNINERMALSFFNVTCNVLLGSSLLCDIFWVVFYYYFEPWNHLAICSFVSM